MFDPTHRYTYRHRRRSRYSYRRRCRCGSRHRYGHTGIPVPIYSRFLFVEGLSLQLTCTISRKCEWPATILRCNVYGLWLQHAHCVLGRKQCAGLPAVLVKTGRVWVTAGDSTIVRHSDRNEQVLGVVVWNSGRKNRTGCTFFTTTTKTQLQLKSIITHDHNLKL